MLLKVGRARAAVEGHQAVILASSVGHVQGKEHQEESSS